jgi:hypothetical protein
MRYLLMICQDEKAWAGLSEEERQRIYLAFRQLREQLIGTGQFVDGSQLQPTASATTVRLRQGKRLVTDGPFAETREQLAGYFLIDVKNLDEAIDIAGRIPTAATGTIEIRPLIPTAVPAASR